MVKTTKNDSSKKASVTKNTNSKQDSIQKKTTKKEEFQYSNEEVIKAQEAAEIAVIKAIQDMA
ncbi:MAG: hypothetical protein COA88_05910 [Kordia sp.]|nr:MAG: hypothetical protein COA88_05910 [Kordia sp.]